MVNVHHFALPGELTARLASRRRRTWEVLVSNPSIEEALTGCGGWHQLTSPHAALAERVALLAGLGMMCLAPWVCCFKFAGCSLFHGLSWGGRDKLCPDRIGC
eukprot:TRINITY_DN24615_c0_g1_i1.p1 TRINITY_DN24615_c0_g1~~TRINITY_DN24615_c0_g1_i1.p1  ORF type:complete len:103 (-),score=3.74 TRINITY_DN24615_c0_g1_i1:63-371(-)